MNIIFVTTRASLEENKRIETEARNMGHEFLLLDLKDFEYAVTDGKLIVREFTNLKPDIIIVRGIFNSVKSIATYIKGLRQKGTKVFDNNFFEHLYSINKVSDFIKLAQSGVPIPDSFHLHSYDKFSSAAETLGYPVIMKLTRTGKGAGVYKFENPDTLQNFISELEEREVEPKSYMLQKFIDYEFDLRVLIIGEAMFCMRRIPGDGEFRANFSLGGSVELYDLDDEGKKLAKNALSAVNLEIGGVDILIAKDGKRYILEVNHTAGFLGMEKATGINIGKIWLEHALAKAR